MGTFISTVGTLTIPEDKRSDFLADAKRVAYEGGLFSRNYTSIFGKELWLLSFPSFTPNEGDPYADFTYSYYENAVWENVGIDLKRYKPYSGKIGWSRFNQAVQSLYILAELYSETPFSSRNSSVNRPNMTIQWLRYVLGRDVQYIWRKFAGNILELLAEQQISRSGTVRTEFSGFTDDFVVTDSDPTSLSDALVILCGAERMLEIDDGEKKEKSLLSYLDFIRIYRNSVFEYQKIAGVEEDKQIDYLLWPLICTEEERNKWRENLEKEDTCLGLVFGIGLLTPKAVVKIISELYRRDFWDLWMSVRDRISVAPTPFFDNASRKPDHDVITTEEFFNIGVEERLYWWTKNGDVRLTEEIQEWLRARKRRFDELWRDPIQGEVYDWQKRLVELLAQHPGVYCFEQMFYEFMGNFHEDMFKAAVILLEETANDEKDYRRLLAVFANKNLRYGVFLF